MRSNRHSGNISGLSAFMPTGNRKNELDKPAAIGIVIWLFVQVAALGLCAGRIGLWARAPQATEQSALVVMLAVQVGISSLIFPHLLGTVGSTVLAVASAWPMGQLACYLSDASPGALLRGELYVSIWLLTLHLWTLALPAPAAKLLGMAAVGLIGLGGPVLWYLRTEFRDDRQGSDFLSTFGPIPGAIAQTFAGFNLQSWLELGLIICCGALTVAGTRLNPRRSRQVIH
jgi:hypothetical protein